MIYADSNHPLLVLVICLDGNVPVKYGLKLKTGDKYRQLKEALSHLSGLDVAQLYLVELFMGTVRVRYSFFLL